MEASTLRWILIIVGLLIIGLILLFGNPEKKRKPRASRRQAGMRSEKKAAKRARGRREPVERREPTLGLGAADDSGHEGDDEAFAAGDQGELPIDEADAEAEEAKEPKVPAGPPPDRIITLFLIAQDNRLITGAELLEAAVKTGMDYGQMSIFHRIVEGDSRPVFSMANAAKPGKFDRSAWHEFETGGLVFFTTLPNPLPALDAWDAMLATARRMAEILGAELQDENHNLFSRRREALVREEMREYDRERKARGE